MDPVYEVKEEAENKYENFKINNSPRIKYLSDFKEDTFSNHSFYSSSFVNNGNKFEFETNEVIKEDNAENNIDDANLKKLIENHLKIENFLDKSDFIEDKTDVNVNIYDVEAIKEEVLEDEEITHKINNSYNLSMNIPLSDSFELERPRQTRISVIKPDTIDELVFEEKDED